MDKHPRYYGIYGYLFGTVGYSQAEKFELSSPTGGVIMLPFDLGDRRQFDVDESPQFLESVQTENMTDKIVLELVRKLFEASRQIPRVFRYFNWHITMPGPFQLGDVRIIPIFGNVWGCRELIDNICQYFAPAEAYLKKIEDISAVVGLLPLPLGPMISEHLA